MERLIIDKKVQLLQWLSTLEDEMVIDDLMQLMNSEKMIERELSETENTSLEK